MDNHTPSTRTASGQRRKSILICPTCGHESPPDGDWHARQQADAVALVCPSCDAEVTTRPNTPLDPSPSIAGPAAVAPEMLSSTADLLSAMWRSYTTQVAGWIRP